MGLAKMHAQNTFPTALIYIGCVRSALVSRRVATLFFFDFPTPIPWPISPSILKWILKTAGISKIKREEREANDKNVRTVIIALTL